jgi:hypothetical protein
VRKSDVVFGMAIKSAPDGMGGQRQVSIGSTLVIGSDVESSQQLMLYLFAFGRVLVAETPRSRLFSAQCITSLQNLGVDVFYD